MGSPGAGCAVSGPRSSTNPLRAMPPTQFVTAVSPNRVIIADATGRPPGLGRRAHGTHGRPRARAGRHGRDRVVSGWRTDTVADHLRADAEGITIRPAPPTTITEAWERLAAVDVRVFAVCGTRGGADHLWVCRRIPCEVQSGESATSPGAHYPDFEDSATFEVTARGLLGRHGL